MMNYMTLSEIQNMVQGSCDVGWIEGYTSEFHFWNAIISCKSADTGFGHLVQSIMDNGFDDDAPIVILDGEINEGHHRLVAAMLLCLDRVPVSDDWNFTEADVWDYQRYAPDGELLSAHYCSDDPYPIPVKLV